MSTIWDLLTDSRTYGERRVERDLTSQIASATAAHASESASLYSRVATLHGDVHQLEKMVARLTAMVGVLAQALGKAGAYDERWAVDELRRIFAQIDPPPPAPTPAAPAHPAGSPYRDGHGAQPTPPAPPAPRLAHCVVCSRDVDAATTNVTAEGIVCDACEKQRALAAP